MTGGPAANDEPAAAGPHSADALLIAYELGAAAMAEHDARALSTGRRARHARRAAHMAEMEAAAHRFHRAMFARPYHPYRGGPVTWDPPPPEKG